MIGRRYFVLMVAVVLLSVIMVVHYRFTPVIPHGIIRVFKFPLGGDKYSTDFTDTSQSSENSSSPSTANPAPAITLPPGLKFVPLPRIEVTEDLTPQEAEDRFYRSVTRNHVTCDKHERLGNRGDGGWDMCTVGPYAPRKPCIVYSFGINNDWTFDDTISNRHGCEVRAFDPSMHVGDHKHSTLVYFYEKGIGATDKRNSQGWKINTLKTILQQAHHSDKILEYLKIDIEYNEWDSFETMFKNNVLKNVKQFGFEIHTHELAGGSPTTVPQFVRYWRILDQLEKAGFRRWYYHFNHYGKYTSRRTGQGRTCCYEMVYINTHFLKGPVPTNPPPVSSSSVKTTTVKAAAGPKTTGEIKWPEGIKPLQNRDIRVEPSNTPSVAENNFYAYVTQNHISCSDHLRLGNFADGGWDLCVSGPYKPASPCIVYSFGINNDWSFDDAISRKFGCQVKAFDPSMRIGDHKHSALVYFYHTGIGGTNTINSRGWKIRTLKKLFDELGDSGKTIDMLKMDIEYNEWDSFRAMFKENALKNVKQFVFEIHTHELAGGRPTTVPEFVNYFGTLKELEKRGFKMWHNHYNPYGIYNSRRTGQRRTCCYEMYYINTNFLR